MVSHWLMDHRDTDLDLAELSARAGVSTRTVRYYIQQGLLHAPGSRGPGAHYGREHLDRLRLIKRLQREHLPLAEIRRRLESLDPGEIRRLAEEVEERAPSSASEYIRSLLSEGPGTLSLRETPVAAYRSSSPEASPTLPQWPAWPKREGERESRPPARSRWDRISLAHDVELHVRRPLSREQNRKVERLMEAARIIFEEDTP